MADADRPGGKRSRFDQTEPEPRKPSRFDRRSRSPPSRRSEARERSSLAKDAPSETSKPSVDPAAAAGTAPTHHASQNSPRGRARKAYRL